ncbi:MAG: LysR family transcriptional regulator, partial [Pseudomonadota bacterium]
MDKLKAMQTFTQIADAGSLTAAARVAESSLPAVVRSLAALEAELGVRLFNRSTRRISLTDEGRRYLDS